MSKSNKILLIILGLIALFIAVQVINAGKYKMMVQVVEGENIMGVNPLTDNLDFGDLSRNNGMTRYVALEGGRIPVYVMVFKIGAIADLVQVSRNYFTLEKGEEIKLAFNIEVPPSAEIKQYTGRAFIFRLPKLW